MSLTPSELSQVVTELALALRGAPVQKAYAPLPGLCYLELRQPGRSVLLCLSTEPGLARLSVAAERFSIEGPATPLQRQLRSELVGAQLEAIFLTGPTEVVLAFRKAEAQRWLVGKLRNTGGAISLLHQVPPLPAQGFVPRGSSSRLKLRPEAAFPHAEAAEAFHALQDGQKRAEEIRRRLLAPLRTKLARSKRTLDKVSAEAGRGAEAESHRETGELLSQNLHRLSKGATLLRVTHYAPEGIREVEIPLRPELSPKKQVEWHFHQYRRLQRGCEHAGRRTRELTSEIEQTQKAIEHLLSLDAEQLLERREILGAPARTMPQRARAYKEYLSADGHRIWVGRSAKLNDELTFRLARPNDLWLHVRGSSGSHVIVPLEKKAVLEQELLLDAAHLALHHSQLKGEPQGEVCYTQAKYVRRPKGAAPGAAITTREKVFLLRVESSRLQRLLSDWRLL